MTRTTDPTPRSASRLLDRLSPWAPFLALLVLIPAILALEGCAGLLGAAGVEEPGVTIESTRFSGVTLQKADLDVRFRIDNPNSFGLQLAGLDYELDVAGRTLFTGDRRESLALKPQGVGFVDLPITVTYSELYDAVRDLWSRRGQGKADYTLRAGLRFDVPVLGVVRVPVEAEGDIPLM
jgi:LEA14-like dessication related protein